MLHRVNRRVSRAVRALLPATTADAGCAPDPYYEYQAGGCTGLVQGACCYRRRCSTNGACVVICGAWVEVSNGC